MKNHIGFYPTPSGIDNFKKELAAYKSGKGSLQFPLDKPLPLELIRKIVELRVKENSAKTEAKKDTKKSMNYNKIKTMKQIITLFFLLNVKFIFCQSPCDDYSLYIRFDDSSCLSRLDIDTTVFKHNIWQIGLPHKSVIDSTACQTIVIITDTTHSYPINDTSVFIIVSRVTYGSYYGCRMFNGSYYVQTDSLKDYGKMEFSPDKGITWIDMLKDTAYSSSFIWYSKPVLTGHSRTCRYFDALFGDLASVFNLQLGDTLLFRFTFISDSIYDNLGGLMYDNFSFSDFVEGISKIRFIPIKSKSYPNPTSDIFTIEFENPISDQFELSIYDIHSKLVLKKENVTESKIVIDATSFESGVYIYKLTNLKANKRCWGKLITTK